MREIFFDTLMNIAKNNDRIFLLAGDVGYGIFKKYKNTFPKRMINVGVAEANLIGIGAGLSLSGKNVYCYSITPFITTRCFEQIRIDLCYQNLDVKLVGSGAGLTYGLEGMTHHAIEDISIMRSLPNMTVVAPGDPIEYKAIARLSVSQKGPMFIRLEKKYKPKIHSDSTKFKIGKGSIIDEGNDITIIATGSMLHTAKIVSDELRKRGISATLISMHTIKPLDETLILDCAKNSNAIFTIEEHSIIGGLGSAVSEVLSEVSYSGLFKRIGLPDKYHNTVGTPEYLRKKCSLTPEQIEKTIIKLYKK